MQDAEQIIYLRIDGQIWAYYPDGQLALVQNPALLGENIAIVDVLPGDIIQRTDGSSYLSVNGQQLEINLDAVADQQRYNVELRVDDNEQNIQNEGLEYIYQVKRSNSETIAESGFDTQPPIYEARQPHQVEASISSDWKHRDGATITVIIEDNDYPIGLEGYINQFEAPSVRLHGTVFNIDDERNIVVTVTDKLGRSLSFDTIVSAGAWDLGAVSLQGLAEGDVIATASVTDSFDAVVSGNDQSIKDVLARAIDISITSGSDLIIDDTESRDLQLIGNFENVQTGAVVYVLFTDRLGNTLEFLTKVEENGSWLLTSADIHTLVDGEVNAIVRTVDQAGNPAEISGSGLLIKNPYITINAIDNDDVINQYESPTQLFRGIVLNVESGQQITVTITDDNGGLVSQLVTVTGKTWSANIDVSTLIDGNLSAVADVLNIFGDSATANTNIELDQTALIDVAFADPDVINAMEALMAELLGGTTDIEDNQTVSVSVEDSLGKQVVGTAAVVGSAWQLDGLDLSTLTDGTLTVTVSAKDVAGNIATASNTVQYDSTAAITDIMVTIGSDQIINAAEDEVATFSGVTSGIEENQDISIVISDINGLSLPAVIVKIGADGRFNFDQDVSSLADGPLTFSASSEDLAGNLANYSEDIIKDTRAQLTIEFVQDDDYINQFEQNSVDLAGTTVDVNDGETVTVVISDGNSARDITVTALVEGNAWSITGVDVSSLDDTAVSGNRITATADVTDKAGNPATADTSIEKDTVVTADIITPVDGDDDGSGGFIINNGIDIVALKNGDVLSLSGASDAEIGQPVVISVINTIGETQTFTGKVVDGSGNWLVEAIQVTDLQERFTWRLSATVTDIAGNMATDIVPIIKIPESASIGEYGIAAGAIPTDTIRINSSGSDADASDDFRFSNTQTELETIVSSGDATRLVYVSDLRIELRTVLNDELVLAADINSVDATVTISLHRNVDQPTRGGKETVLDSIILIETTQTDDDGTTETILAPIDVELTNAPPTPLVDYFADALEDARISGNLLEDNESVTGPVRLFQINIDTTGDGLLDTVMTIDRGSSITVDTVKGQFTFYSNADWVLDATRNLDHNLPQQVKLELSAYDAFGNPGIGEALFNIRDGAQGDIDDSKYTVTEADLGGSSSDIATFVAHAGSDDVVFQTVRFSREAVFIIDGLNLSSNGVGLTVFQSADGDQITAYVGPASNRDIAFRLLAAAAPADADGNSNVDVTVSLFVPLDHNTLNNIIEFTLPIIGDDADGTDLLTGLATVNFVDGNDPDINVTTPLSIDETTVDQAPIIVSGQINVDVGSDAIASVGFLSLASFPELTSNGYPVFYRTNDDGSRLEAYVAQPTEKIVFAIDIIGTPESDTASSVDYNFTLFDSLDQINQLSDTINFNIPVFVLDADGDATQGEIALAVIDGELPVITLDPEFAPAGIILSETPQNPVTADVPDSGKTSLAFTAGADRLISQQFDVTYGSPIPDANGNPVTQNGVVLELRKVDEVTIIAVNPDTGLRVLTFTVRTLDIDFNDVPAGQTQNLEVTLTVNGSIDHLAPDGSKLDKIDFDLPLKATDSDGDVVKIDFPFSVIDGKDPSIISANPLVVDEAGVNDDDDDGETGQTTISLGVSSDAIAGFSIDISAFNALGLRSQGDLVSLTTTPPSYTAVANGRDIFTIAINASGVVKMTLLDSLDHIAPDDLSLSFPLSLTAIDVDSDQSPPEAITITVTDGVPTAEVDLVAVYEGETVTGNVLANDHLAADGGTITNLAFNGSNIPVIPGPDRFVFNIVVPEPGTGVLQNAGTFTLYPNGDYELVTFDFESLVIEDISLLKYTVEDFDGDSAESEIIIAIQDSGFVITPPSELENNEDTEFLLDFTFFAADVEPTEVVRELAILADSTDGGRLFFEPADGSGRIELMQDNGRYRLIDDQIDYDTATGVAKPNGRLIYLPAEDVSNANDTISSIKPDADFKLTALISTLSLGGLRREFTGEIDLSVISVADTPEWQDNIIAVIAPGGDIERYIVTIDEGDTAANLNLVAISVDNDLSEVISYTIVSIDSGITLSSQGVAITAGMVINQQQLTALKVTADSESLAGSFTVNITANSTELDNADVATKDVVLQIDFTPVADKPTIAVKDIFSLEDEFIDLSTIIDGELTDTDGSETLSFELIIPDGWQIYVNGSAVAGTTVIVDGIALLSGNVTLLPYQDISSYQNDFNLSVTPISTESSQGGISPVPVTQRGDTKTVAVTIKGVVDTPSTEVGDGWLLDGSGDIYTLTNTADNLAIEDSAIALDFIVSTTDIDNSEFSNLLLSDLPDGSYFVDASNNRVDIPVIGFDSSNQPIYQLTTNQLSSLSLQPPRDFSGILTFSLQQVITEPDGDSESFTIDVNIEFTPLVEEPRFIPELGISVPGLIPPGNQHFEEDKTSTLKLKPTLLDIDGSEQVTDVILSGLPENGIIVIDGKAVVVDSSGSITLSDHSSDVTATLDNNSVSFLPPEDFAGRYEWNIQYQVTDTAPGTGRTDVNTIDTLLFLDVHPIVETDTELVGSGDVIQSIDGKVDLTGTVQFNDADIDGSEWLDSITVIMPNNEDFFVTHPNGAIHMGNGQWLINAGNLTSSSVQDMMVEIVDGLVISASVPGEYIIGIDVRVIDQAPSWHIGSNLNFNTLTDGRVLSTDIDVIFTEAIDDGVACDPSDLVPAGEIIDGEEDVRSTDIGSHLNTDIAVDCDGLDNDEISFRILASSVPRPAWIGGPGVQAEYDATGDVLIAWYFKESAVPTLELRNVEQDFAGTIDIPVLVIATDASGDTKFDNSQILKIEIAPIVDASIISIAGNIVVQEDSDSELGLYLDTEDSNQANEGIETVDPSIPVTLTLLDESRGVLTLAPEYDQSQLVDNGNGVYTLLDPTLLANIRFRAPKHMDGEFRLLVEGGIVDVADGYSGDQIDRGTFSSEVIITVEPVTDNVIILQTLPLVGNEDEFISLSALLIRDNDNNETHEINPEFLPPGSSEIVTVTLESVPADATIYYDNGDGTYSAANNNGLQADGTYNWSIDFDRIDQVVFKAPKDFSGDIDINIKIISHEKGTEDYKITEKAVTIGVLPIADGSNAFASFQDVTVDEGQFAEIDINASVIDNDTDGDESVLVYVEINADSDPSATYFIERVEASDGTTASFIDLGIGADPRYVATIETTSDSLDSLKIITNTNAQGVLHITLGIGSSDSNRVLGQSVANQGGFITQDLLITIDPELDPAVISTQYDRLVAVEGDEIPLSLTLSTINPADMETTVIEISGLPAGYSITGGSFDNGVWTVNEADISAAAIVGADDLFGNFVLQVKPVSELNGDSIDGNVLTVGVSVAEVPDAGLTVMQGSAGNDRFYGNDDAQNIIGSTGSDLISTGGGNDTIIFNKGDGSSFTTTIDTVTDFDTVSSVSDVSFDTINLTDMLSDFDTTTIEKIDALIDIADNGNGGTTIKINNESAIEIQTIELENVTTMELNGGTAPGSEAELLQKMIDDQTLVVNI